MLMSDDRAKGYAAKDRQDFVRRAKLLFATGRVTREVAKRLVREFESVQLSYTTAGEMHDPPKAALQLEAYEQLPKHSAFAPTPTGRELSATRPAAGKHPLAGEKVDDKAGEEFLAGLTARLGGPKK
jgi:hypothetical protein